MRDDAALVQGLRDGEVWARAQFFDRYAPMVERILRRILGNELCSERTDLVHDVFVQALASIDRVRDPAALPAWMQAVTTRTAGKAIRARRARRWICFWEPSAVADMTVDDGIEPQVLEAYRRTYAVLDRFPADERVAFALRHIDGMDLAELASVCGVSLATIKRRLARAEQRFTRAAERDEVLRSWLKEGGRWTA